MRFSNALVECMDGKKITRLDWNGRNMYVYFVKPHRIPVKDWRGDIPLTDSERLRGYVEIAGHFDMMNAQGLRIIGWLASQTDMASDKWIVLDDSPHKGGYIGSDRVFHTYDIDEDDEDDKDDHARNQYPNTRD